MLFERIEHGGHPRWARVTPGRRRLLADAPWLDDTETGDEAPPDARVLAPASPSKIVCVGRNYAAHAAELGNPVPTEPLLFLKPPSALIGPDDPILLPAASQRVEHEGELALVIGERLCAVSPERAREGIFGYTIANDVTARDLQRADVQFTRGKGFDTFCPLGPRLVRGIDPLDLALRTEVGDEIRQESRTSHMIFDPFVLTAYISAIMTLEPGDVVLTGTPAGVGPLLDEDEVRVVIEKIGTLRNPVHTRRAGTTIDP